MKENTAKEPDLSKYDRANERLLALDYKDDKTAVEFLSTIFDIYYEENIMFESKACQIPIGTGMEE